MANKAFSLNFIGDTMLGRLIDQMFPQHVYEPEEAEFAQSFLSSEPGSKRFEPETPWGNVLPLLHSADLNLLNLETSATTHPDKWPNKVFNYRMHPSNIAALTAAKIDYATLANNHTLDFCEPGLLETVRTVRQAGVAFAGAGESKDEASQPAVLTLKGSKKEHAIHVWAASDHPADWADVATFNFLDYSQEKKDELKSLLSRPSSKDASLRIFSVHWGPNYSWQPSKEIRDMAHFLIDECGIDIIHGHSSHHVQGVERYQGKLIIYGCGDFVDDYALNAQYRNDLSGVWRVNVKETEDKERLELSQLEIIPTKIERFQARRLRPDEADSEWVRGKIKALSREFGTDVQMAAAGGEGTATVELL